MAIQIKTTIITIALFVLVGCGSKTSSRQVSPSELTSEQRLHETQPANETIKQQPAFQKILTYNNFGFEVISQGEGSIQQLTIQPSGLSADNKKIELQLIGRVSDAVVSDLNLDSYPELLIFTTSAGSGSYGEVVGYSVNNGKSLSQLTFPIITDNAIASKGYMGHDEFSLAGNTLVRRFPVYQPTDTNSEPTGNVRQIVYKLENGEASRNFVVDKIIEFPSK